MSAAPAAPAAVFSFPTTILFGPGSVAQLSERLGALGARKPLLVTDAGLRATAAFEKVMSALPSRCHVFSDIQPNPRERDVDAAAGAFTGHGCDAVVGVGGGSALDVAKVLRLRVKFPQWKLDQPPPDARAGELAPFVAVPTTAGTGSEVGRSSVITIGDTKRVIFHPALLAALVVLDPELTIDLPAKLTAATGADALTHCIESFTSPTFHPLCDGIALEGIRLIVEALPRAVRDPRDLDARGKVLVAATMGGIAFQKDLGAAHALAHPLSAICGVHHGLANALVLPAVMAFNARRKPGLYVRVGEAMGLKDATDVRTIDAVRALLQEIGIAPGLRHHGVQESHVPSLTDQAFADASHQTNPVPVTREDLARLYDESMQNRFMAQAPDGIFIDGEARAGHGDPIQITNPATEETWASVSGAGAEDVDRAVAGARRAFEQAWCFLAPGKRAEILYNIVRLIRAHRDELAMLDVRSVGKPISDARDEVMLGARVFEYYAGAIAHFGGQTISVAAGGFDFTIRQPMGVVAAIVPWNFPFPITCWKIAPALATGNTVVLKPAKPSPLSALRLAQLCAEAGLPAGAFQVLPGAGSEVGETLVTHADVRKISFTGSTPVGSRIMQLAARDIKRVSLELGGKSPNIVFADADLELAATKSPMSVFANAGQDCCARSRVFVERRVFDEFVHRFVSATCAIVVGDPADEKTQVGPLVSDQQRQTVEEFLAVARDGQRRIVCGGGHARERGFFLEPTVVLDCETSDRIWTEEVFGPVVCIRPFDDEEQMLREVNASPYGLSGTIWTRDLCRAMRVARLVESGVLSINSNNSVHVEAPFGGFKQSGLGRDLGTAAMEGYTELKNIYVG